MEVHQEQALKDHLNTLKSHELSNVKAHADAADSEHHDSFKQLKTWLTGLGIISATGTVAGAVWKAIKIIQKH